MSELIVYSCITGGKDRIREDMFLSDGIKYVMYTDDPTAKSKTWDIRPLSQPKEMNLDPIRQAMWHRWHPHMLFGEGVLTLWLDGNFNTKVDPRGYFRTFSGNPLFIRHPYRTDCYQEAQEHIRIGKYDSDRILSQMAYYQRCGYREGQGLVMTGFIGRRVPRLSDGAMVGFFEETFAHVRRWSYRDQLAVNFCARQFGVALGIRESMTECDFFGDEAHLR